MNPGLEAPLFKIISHIKDCLLNYDSRCKLIRNENTQNKLEIELHSKLSDVKFFWKLEFSLLNDESIKNYLLLPLIYSSSEFQLREDELIKIIQSKDRELEDYKSQGVKLTRSKIY